MRKLHKYHQFYTSKFALRKFPLRMFKFRAIKWITLRIRLNRINLKKRRRRLFLNHLKIKVKFKRWERKKRLYSKELQAKRLLYLIFGKSFSLKQLKKEKGHISHRQHVSVFLAKPFFRLDILLWYLDFFSSNYQAKQFITSGAVRVNNKKVTSLFILRKGDNIEIDLNSTQTALSSKIRKCHSKVRTIFSFVELDYYTGRVVIIKSLEELDLYDYALMVQDRLYIKSLTSNF